MDPPSTPWRDAEEIATVAERFLRKYNPSMILPVPIEAIIEHKLEMDIIPLPGLHENFNLEGFITHDFTAIYVDLGRMTVVPTNYRFTLAHEIGHKELHTDVYGTYHFTKLKEFLKFHDLLLEDPVIFQRFETQANIFASMVLMPEQNLRADLADEISKVRDKGVSVVTKREKKFAIEYIAEALAPKYGVSAISLKYRLLNGNFL